MIWNQHSLYQIIDVWYHIRKLYLINNEKNDKIKLNHFFLQTAPRKYDVVNNDNNVVWSIKLFAKVEKT